MQSHDGFGSTLSSAISPLIPNSSRTSCQKWTCKKQTITGFFSSESFHLDANFCLPQAILFFLWTFCKGIMCVTMVLSVISLSYNCLSMSTLMFVFKPKVSKTCQILVHLIPLLQNIIPKKSEEKNFHNLWQSHLKLKLFNLFSHQLSKTMVS